MHNKKNKNTILKATISNTIVAFVYVGIIAGIVAILFSSKISMAIGLINTITVKSEEKMASEVKIDLVHNKLEKKPKYGTKYGQLTIEDLGIDLPIYYGDELSTLRYGIGHTFGSYFPGEGGTIIYMAHNTSGFLRKLPEIKIGTKINVSTSYGDYTYTVDETKIVHMSETSAVDIQDEKEQLILYTCYPVNSIGHAKHRFITYSSLDK